MKEQYLITVDRPKGVTKKEMIQYILDAVITSKGCMHPDDLITDLDNDSIKVKSFNPPIIKRSNASTDTVTDSMLEDYDIG